MCVCLHVVLETQFIVLLIIVTKVLFQLSAALSNRFTEIWCPANDNREDLVSIIEHNLRLPQPEGSE